MLLGSKGAMASRRRRGGGRHEEPPRPVLPLGALSKIDLAATLKIFEERCVGEPPSDASGWGSKLGHSVLDEAALFGEPSSILGAPGDDLLGEKGWGQVPDSRQVKLVQQASASYTLVGNVDTQCPICLDTMSAGSRVWTLPCMHQLHESCAVECFSSRGTPPACPVCRWNVKTAMVTPHIQEPSSAATGPRMPGQ